MGENGCGDFLLRDIVLKCIYFVSKILFNIFLEMLYFFNGIFVISKIHSMDWLLANADRE